MKLPKLLPLLVVLAVGVGHATDANEHHEPPNLGQPKGQTTAPARALPGVQGDLGALELSAYEGKVVVLTTLAGWCVGCFAEVPAFVALQNDYADRNVVVVGIMTQSAPEWMETFVERYEVSYPIFLDMSGQATTERFGPGVMPTAMMVYDRQGKLVESLSGFDADTLRPCSRRCSRRVETTTLLLYAGSAGALATFNPYAYTVLPAILSRFLARGQGGVRAGLKLGALLALGTLTAFAGVGALLALVGMALGRAFPYVAVGLALLFLLLEALSPLPCGLDA
jgi:peroxiredoxin